MTESVSEIVERLLDYNTPLYHNHREVVADALQVQQATIEHLQARLAEVEVDAGRLLSAAKAVRDDLIMRSDYTDSDGVAVVECGASVWWKLNEAIDTAIAQEAG